MKQSASIRLQCESKAEAETISAWLRGQLGAAVQLGQARPGRGDGVWFVYGSIIPNAAAHQQTSIEAVIRDTGEIVTVRKQR